MRKMVILKSITKKISEELDFEHELDNFLLLNKNRKIKFFQQTHIPPINIPIPENDPIRRESGKENTSHIEIRGYFLITLVYED